MLLRLISAYYRVIAYLCGVWITFPFLIYLYILCKNIDFCKCENLAEVFCFWQWLLTECRLLLCVVLYTYQTGNRRFQHLLCCVLYMFWDYFLRQIKLGDHLSGKPGNVRKLYRCQGNVRNFTTSQGIVREKILSWKIVAVDGTGFLMLSLWSHCHWIWTWQFDHWL